MDIQVTPKSDRRLDLQVPSEIHSREFKNVILIPGGFHIQMTFTKVIGKYLESSGMSDIWANTKIFSKTTAGNILKGKVWSRVI